MQRGHGLVYGLTASWEPQCCTDFFFLIDNSSHLKDIFSFKENTAFPCNKPNKIARGDLLKKNNKKIVEIVYFSLVKLSQLKRIAIATFYIAGICFLMEN